uniref:Uncharacterized protein n=1 Tax=Plectus sambesii TaxID=2011161 RepID=A0A914UUS1_9BILA
LAALLTAPLTASAVEEDNTNEIVQTLPIDGSVIVRSDHRLLNAVIDRSSGHADLVPPPNEETTKKTNVVVHSTNSNDQVVSFDRVRIGAIRVALEVNDPRETPAKAIQAPERTNIDDQVEDPDVALNRVEERDNSEVEETKEILQGLDATLFNESATNDNEDLTLQRMNDVKEEGDQQQQLDDNEDSALLTHSLGEPSEPIKTINGGIQTPSFAGESYLKHRAPEEFRDYVQVELQFNPTEPNGIIYFEGQAQRDEYVVIYLKDAFVYMQFDLGGGAAQLRSERPVTLHAWHKIEAWRSGRGGILKTDAQPWVETIAPGGFARIAPGHAYLGGAPTDALPSSLQLHGGFHGCIREALLNAKRLQLLLGAESSVDVRECGADPCRPNPCRADGQCAVYHDNYLCLCSHPNTGDHCEQTDDMLHQAIGLLGHGYLKFDQKEVMKHITGDRMDFSMTFKLRNTTQFRYDDDQMLAFAGETENRGDFFKLLVTNTHTIKLMINLGAGVVSLTHDQARLTDADWHTVAVKRTGRKITVAVDDYLPLTTTAPAGAEQLNVYEALYIGGYPIERGLFPGSGLRGCVSNIDLSPTFRIDQVQQAAQAMNVISCERL